MRLTTGRTFAPDTHTVPGLPSADSSLGASGIEYMSSVSLVGAPGAELRSKRRPRVLALIQARMTSTRLPGKILKPVLGRPLLEYEIERLRAVPNIDQLAVATTTNADDDPVEELCRRLGVGVFRGSEDDVLGRFMGAAQKFGWGEGDVMVRLTGDCPMLDPGIAEAAINIFIGDNAAGYRVDHLGAEHESVPHGMDVEVFWFDALARADREGRTKMDREHVTWHLWHNPDKFATHSYRHPANASGLRLTVDTPEDFEAVSRIIEALYPKNPLFTLADIARYLERHDDIKHINDGVHQRHYR